MFILYHPSHFTITALATHPFNQQNRCVPSATYVVPKTVNKIVYGFTLEQCLSIFEKKSFFLSFVFCLKLKPNFLGFSIFGYLVQSWGGTLKIITLLYGPFGYEGTVDSSAWHCVQDDASQYWHYDDAYDDFIINDISYNDNYYTINTADITYNDITNNWLYL
jgi:hypothetical protein